MLMTILKMCLISKLVCLIEKNVTLQGDSDQHGEVRKKTGPDGRCKYNTIYLTNAVKAIQSEKLSIRKASEEYGVPYTTLYDKINNKYKLKMGGQTALSREEEKTLVEGLLMCAKWGFPLRDRDIKNVVQNTCCWHT